MLSMLSFSSTLFFLPLIVRLLHFTSPSVIFTKADRVTVGSSQDGREVSRELFDSLEELARIVDISYCVGTSGVREPFQCLNRCDEFEGFELVTAWNTGPLLSDSCGYVALSHPPFPKRIIIAFRGTYSIANTIVDLSLYPQPYVPYTGDGDGEGKPKCSNCTVHAGFMTAWQNTRPAILPHLLTARKQHPDYKLVLVGHSLGGAVAALAGLEMQSRGWNPQVTTFGEPRVGNEAFVSYLNRRFGLVNTTSEYAGKNTSSGRSHGEQLRFRRVTHVNDPVPLLPLGEFGYKMHGGEIFIFKLDLPPSISDLELCVGNQDARCIAGAEALKSLGKPRGISPVGTGDRLVLSDSVNQVALSDGELTSSRISFDNNDHDVGPQSAFDILRPLIPSRFRIWELVFAHRDYFWRLGVCLPGGDPTRFRTYRA